MPDFSIGLSGLSVSQRLIDLTGQNISNASTPGYHRQVADLVNRVVGTTGNGVQIADIGRMRNNLIEGALNQNTMESQDVTTQLQTLQQVQTLLTPGDGSVNTLLENFFNQGEQLAAQPSDVAQRQVFLGAATALTGKINSLANGYNTLRSGLDAQIKQQVDQINQLTPQIAQLNQVIQQNSLKQVDTNDLRDQRDHLINQLAQSVNVQTIEQPDGQTNVLAAGAPLVLGNRPVTLQVATDNQNHAIVRIDKSSPPLNVTGGQLAGFLQVRNQSLPDFQNRLESLAQGLAKGLDELNATGLGLSGPLTSLSGVRAVSNAAIPLAQAGLALPPQAGTLAVSVTNLATGQRTLTQIAIDPQTQTLQNVAAAITGVGHIQGIVDPQTNTLKIIAQPGYAFDFAGRLPTSPETTAVTGTTTPQLSGTYTGTSNDNYTFRVVGSGTIGVTPNLTLQVTNSKGILIDSANIGQGYQPGTPLPAVNGVAVALAAGTANVGDTFSTHVVAKPDSGNLLTALGVNTFFAGSHAIDLGVRPDLAAFPQQLAASSTGQPGDGANLQRMVALRDSPLLTNGTQTLSQFANAMVGDIGGQVQSLNNQQTAQQALGQQLQAQQQSVSGVNPNEELVNMLNYQRSFQMSAKYITVINDTLTQLLQIIR